MDIESLRNTFVGGQIRAQIGQDEVRMDIRGFDPAEGNDLPSSPDGRVVAPGEVMTLSLTRASKRVELIGFVGVTWKRELGEPTWLPSLKTVFYLKAQSIRRRHGGVWSGRSNHGGTQDVHWTIYPPGHPSIVTGFQLPTVTVDDVLREYGEVEFDLVKDESGFTATNVAVGGKRIPIVPIKYTTTMPNVWSTGIRQASLVGGMVEVRGWLKLESGGMAFGSRPISGSGATVLEAIKNAYGE